MIPRFLRHHPVFQSLPVWVILYFSLFFVIGGICFSDYGISTDETQQRLIGQTSLQFLSHVFHLSSLLKDTIPLTDPSSVFLAVVTWSDAPRPEVSSVLLRPAAEALSCAV